MAQMANGHASVAVVRSIWLLFQRFKERSSPRISDPFSVLGSAGISPDVFMPACERLRSLGYIKYGSRTGSGNKTTRYILLLKNALGPDILQGWQPEASRGQGNGIPRNTDWTLGFLEEDEEEEHAPEGEGPSPPSPGGNAPIEGTPRGRTRGRVPKQRNAVLAILRENAHLTESGELCVDYPVELLPKLGIPLGSITRTLKVLETKHEIRKVRDSRDQRKIGAVILLKASGNA